MMILAAFVAGALAWWLAEWFLDWLLIAPIDPQAEPTEHWPHDPYGVR